MATESFFSNASLAYLASAGAGKDGKTYSIKPTDGTGDFTFSRGSNLTATRVGPTGLIEKGRENLLLQSNNFTTTWNVLNSPTLTSGQIGYDGSSDAWLFESTTTGTAIVNQNISSSGVQTISLYAKAGTSDYLAFYNSSAIYAFFDLNNGSVGFTSGDIDAKIQDIGSGWYRCSMTYNSSITYVRIYVADADNNFNSAIGSNIYIQDAQLEVGLAATDYIESGASTGKAGLLENEPRFDYSGGATCPSLLLEPSRTNLIDYSEYFGSVWSLSNINPTYNHSTSPEGLQNATLMQPTTNDAYLREMSNSFISGNTYVASIYLKSNSGSIFDLDFRLRESGGGQNVTETKTITTEWQRFEISLTATITGTYQFWIGTSGTWSLGEDLLIWGAQIEQGSYPTSYIPNHSGGIATRTQDVCALPTGGVNETEGTFFIDYGDSPNVDVLFASSTSKNLITNNIRLSKVQLYIRNGGGNLIIASVTPPDSGKLALKYSTSGVKIFANGGSTPIYESTTSITFDGPIDYVRLGSRVSDLQIEEFKPKQFLIFQEALSDADCITLTT